MSVIPAWGRARRIRVGEEEAEQRNVASFAYKRWKDAHRDNWLWGGIAAFEGIIIFLLSSALFASVPNIRLFPVFYPVQSDGTADPPKAVNAVAADFSEQGMRSFTLQLVNACEGYLWSNAQYRYDLCSLMLAKNPRAIYQARWFGLGGKPNKEENPQVLYPEGQIDIEKISIEVRRGHVAEMRFRRIVSIDGKAPVDRKTCKPPACTTWTAIVDLEAASKMTQEDRDQVQSGLVATRYQLNEGKL